MNNSKHDPAGEAANIQPLLPESLCTPEALAWLEDGRITLGMFRAKLDDAPPSMQESFVTYFAFLTETAGVETRSALGQLSRRVRGGATKPRAADWQPLLDALRREPVDAPVTDETTLIKLSERLWREHTRQD